MYNQEKDMKSTGYYAKWETKTPEFIGLKLEDAISHIWKAGLEHYIINVDGNWNEQIRTSQLRPKEVNLMVENGIVTKAYRIL